MEWVKVINQKLGVFECFSSSGSQVHELSIHSVPRRDGDYCLLATTTSGREREIHLSEPQSSHLQKGIVYVAASQSLNEMMHIKQCLAQGRCLINRSCCN